MGTLRLELCFHAHQVQDGRDVQIRNNMLARTRNCAVAHVAASDQYGAQTTGTEANSKLTTSTGRVVLYALDGSKSEATFVVMRYPVNAQ